MIRLPWTMASGPHLLLEVTGRCNLACRACYKPRSELLRSLPEIEADLDTALRLRRVQTVSLSGGEPTLHPQLPAIVALVHRRGLRCSLLTNGLALTDGLLSELKQTGLDVVMLHVDEGQPRPDRTADVNALRRQLACRVAGHGLDVGLSVTLYRESLPALPSLVRLVFTTPEISFVFITHSVDVGTVLRGLPAEPERTTNDEVVERLRVEFGLVPFAGVGPGNAWISYFVPVADGEPVRLRAGWLDAWLLRLPRLLTGCHLFYLPPRPGMVRAQVLANLFAHGQFRRAAQLRSARFTAKRLIFDNGLDAACNCAEFCPNPTVRGDRLVPVCVADHVGAA